MLKDRTIVLGVTGSIAVYKAADLASQLTQAGARVDVIMTESSMEFVSALTFRSLTGRPVVTSMFELSSEYSVEHVALAEAADIVVIAPATANTIARLAAGLADDMVTCTVLATRAPVVVAPAMDVHMYENVITQDNIEKLKARGFIFVGPGYGRLASGLVGKGRFIVVSEIIGTICQVLGKSGDFKEKRVIVTAGGTQERLDPVRCVTNYSSGKMGYAMAEAARDRGASVTLVTTPTALPRPAGVDIVDVCSAEEMNEAVKKAAPGSDVLIMAAAVADYRPVITNNQKIKRESSSRLVIEFERTPDILGEVKGQLIRVGFAAESENVVENAKNKLKKKGLDLIVANDITAEEGCFGADTNEVAIIDRDGKVEQLPRLSKREVADKILDKVADIVAKT
jgi:phosphopantothenoylcysteine decarboxylase/phosphopantothenate--cysteine ligase